MAALFSRVSKDLPSRSSFLLFFFNDTATTEIYTLSLHDALPISSRTHGPAPRLRDRQSLPSLHDHLRRRRPSRSEEHTSELQSLAYLVCRLLLEKKKKGRNKALSSLTNTVVRSNESLRAPKFTST